MNDLNEEVKIGLFGYGYWGRIYHRALTELRGVKISYVCDSNSNIEGIIPGGTSFFTDPEKAIDEGGVDAVFVITPAGTHKEIVLRALKKGLNTFVEKPALLSSSDLNTVLSQKPSNALFFPGHIYAYNDMVKSFVKSVKDSGERLNSLTSSRKALGPIRSDVGCVWDLLPHDLTIFDLLDIGVPVSVACTAHYPLKLGHEDIAHCDIHYTSGLAASVELSWIFPYKFRRSTVITESSIYVFDETNKDLPIGFVRFQNGILEGVNNVAYNMLTTNQYINKISSAKSEPLKNMIRTFIEAVSTGDQREGIVEIQRAKMIISTIEAVLKSILGGGRKTNIKMSER